MRRILTSRFPDIYIFFVLGIGIAALDVLLKKLLGTTLLYPYVVDYGWVKVIVTVLLLWVFMLIIYLAIRSIFFAGEMAVKTSEFYRDRVFTYLGSQNITLGEEETIYAASHITSPKKDSYVRAYVLTNQRFFRYEFDRIVKEIVLEEINSVTYQKQLNGRIAFCFRLSNDTSYDFDISWLHFDYMLTKLKELLGEKVRKKGD